MVRISKNNTIHTGKKNVDIQSIIKNTVKFNLTKSENLNIAQHEGKNNLNKKKYLNNNFDDESDIDDISGGSDADDADEDDNDNENDVVDDVEVDDVDADEADEENDDSMSEKSDKESDYDKEEKNYIEDENTLKSKCYSKYAKLDYDDLDFDELFGEEKLLVVKNVRISKPILTKYEFVRLLTDRSKQLAQGAKPMLKNIPDLTSKEIAKLELKNKIIPLIIERPIPNSVSERWKLSELEIPEHYFTL